MTYVQEIEDNPPIIKISKDMKNIILVNQDEHYLLEIKEDKDGRQASSVMKKLKIQTNE